MQGNCVFEHCYFSGPVIKNKTASFDGMFSKTYFRYDISSFNSPISAYNSCVYILFSVTETNLLEDILCGEKAKLEP